MGERIIITVMGKSLDIEGKASDELFDRCNVASKVMKERHGALVIPTGKRTLKMGYFEKKQFFN